jgi:2-C-methyl-D-erythritol 4-phosphate cytidylyltransferase
VKAAAIIVAAGAGRRFRGRTPKQFVDLAGRPVFLWSVLAFRRVAAFKQIVLVVPENRLRILAHYRRRYGIELVAGGAERFDSVRAGLAALRPDIGCVAIHDAARPLIGETVIRAGLTAAVKYGASVVAVPAKDTVKLSADGRCCDRTMPRAEVWLAQTPQTFRRRVIETAYRKLASARVTDDAQAAEQAGFRVRIVPGDDTNFKITERADHRMAASLITARRPKGRR